MKRSLRLGMVGGGAGSFIGDVHRKAAALDGCFELVAGVFSATASQSKAFARGLELDPERSYGSFDELIERESALPLGTRVDVVAIVTPNHLHFSVAAACLRAGFHVVCDKPMTINAVEARELKQIVTRAKRVFALTHNYSGYPMVRLARDMVRRGDLGVIRKVAVHYAQGGLTTSRGKARLGTWRMDPDRVGGAGALGDIGTHAHHLAEYVSGLRVREVCADLTVFTPKQKVDDDCSVLLRFDGGARGVLTASRIAAGEKNGLTIAVYGETGGLEWRQEQPEYLRVMPAEGPETIWNRGNPAIEAISPAAHRANRLPNGHPEGFIEAFANLYRNIADTIIAIEAGERPDPIIHHFPNVDDGLRGVLFVEAVLKNARAKQKFTRIPVR